MEWLNYHHLLYFWRVVRDGGLAKASVELRLAPSTVSGQIKALEDSLGEQLFVRSGRRRVLTEVGRLVYRYAEDIFSLGRELQDAVKGRPSARPLTLRVGVADVVPKLIARRLLEPALKLPQPVQLVCREDKPERLLAELGLHALDVVLTDAPGHSAVRVPSYSHLVGESAIAFFGTPALALAHRRNFPRSLDGAPLLLPTENTALRRALDQWFIAQRLRPRVVAEFEDSALLKVFGQLGTGLFPAHATIAAEVRRQYQVRMVGRTGEVRERFYAISTERRLEHPAVRAIALAGARVRSP